MIPRILSNVSNMRFKEKIIFDGRNEQVYDVLWNKSGI